MIAATQEQKLGIDQGSSPSAEFEAQLAANNAVDVLINSLQPDQNGQIIIALGAVGGNGASSKAGGLLTELAARGVDTCVVAMNQYLEQNPLIARYLSEQRTRLVTVDDSDRSPTAMYRSAITGVNQATSSVRTAGVVCLGPRTYYPFAALVNDVKPVIIDGAVPDKWTDTSDVDGLPNTAYDRNTYINTLYLTTCGFTGWKPPQGTYPDGQEVQVVAQPFSKQKIEFLRLLRQEGPKKMRAMLRKSGILAGLSDDAVLIVPTMDQVYLDSKALKSQGGFMTADQLGQCYAFMTELIAASRNISDQTGRETALYLRPGIMQEVMAQRIAQYTSEKFRIISGRQNTIPNEDWLRLRQAADIEIGRAPLCVSTAEALGMNKKIVLSAVPGVTVIGADQKEVYMTEPTALSYIRQNKPDMCTTVMQGESLQAAIMSKIR